MASRGWLLVALVGLVVLFFGGTQVWVSGQIPQEPFGVIDLAVVGTDATQLITASALLAGAGLLGGLIGARPVRIIAGGVILAGGVLAAAGIVSVIADPAGAVAMELAERTGVTGGQIDPGHTLAATGWPWASLTGAVCMIGGGILRWWSPATAADRDRVARTDAPAPAGQQADPTPQRSVGSSGALEARRADALSAWNELSEGADPTELDTDAGAASDTSAATGDGPDRPGAGEPGAQDAASEPPGDAPESPASR